MAVAIIYPASMSIMAAFTEDNAFSLVGFERILEHETIGREIIRTLVFAGGSMLGLSLIHI